MQTFKVEFPQPGKRRMDLFVSLLGTVFFAGLTGYAVHWLGFPQAQRSTSNLVGIGMLALFCGFFLVDYLLQTLALLFEVSQIDTDGRNLFVRYRYLGSKVLPMGVRIRRLKLVHHFRFDGKLGSRKLTVFLVHPILLLSVPEEMPAQDDLAELLVSKRA